ncbi:MAG: copper chaperone Copz family protein [Nitrosomonadales bacterium]|nr:copper chaperone Copz family protein [Nitrosomonadales bacterium]
MSDCCSPANSATAHPKKHRCPKNGIEYHEVSARTILHHIKQSWLWQDRGRRYFFCDDPDCEVVYFADDDTVILKSQLRTGVGVKETGGDALLCYCFGITKADAAGNPGVRDFVVEKTRLGLCSCETSNPSGRCCLKDFPRS